MKIEEFYSVIRRDTDPVDFSTLKQETTGVYYSESEDKVVDSGTAYFLNVFKQHGNKGFFWNWNWAAFLAPTTFAFYRGIYFFWFLKWVCVVPILVLQEISLETSSIMLGIYLIIQRLYFALAANSMYLKKVKQRFNENKDTRLTPSTLGGVCGAFVIPSVF